MPRLGVTGQRIKPPASQSPKSRCGPRTHPSRPYHNRMHRPKRQKRSSRDVPESSKVAIACFAFHRVLSLPHELKGKIEPKESFDMTGDLTTERNVTGPSTKERASTYLMLLLINLTISGTSQRSVSKTVGEAAALCMNSRSRSGDRRCHPAARVTCSDLAADCPARWSGQAAAPLPRRLSPGCCRVRTAGRQRGGKGWKVVKLQAGRKKGNRWRKSNTEEEVRQS